MIDTIDLPISLDRKSWYSKSDTLSLNVTATLGRSMIAKREWKKKKQPGDAKRSKQMWKIDWRSDPFPGNSPAYLSAYKGAFLFATLFTSPRPCSLTPAFLLPYSLSLSFAPRRDLSRTSNYTQIDRYYCSCELCSILNLVAILSLTLTTFSMSFILFSLLISAKEMHMYPRKEIDKEINPFNTIIFIVNYFFIHL